MGCSACEAARKRRAMIQKQIKEIKQEYTQSLTAKPNNRTLATLKTKKGGTKNA